MRVLLVEDNAADAWMAALILKESGLPHVISVVLDGEEAIAVLHRGEPYADARCPDLVILDLNLPKIDGIAVLQAIGNLREKGEMIAGVVVISGLGDPRQRQAALALGADAYFAKPQVRDRNARIGLRSE